jgi:tRNA-specific 2-thiouridylase
MSCCTAIALSGGVDSLVAAALLKDLGHHVIALHFLTGYEKPAEPTGTGRGAVLDQMRAKLAPLADQLDIPLYIIDLNREFKSLVVDYFVRTYAAGRTPNPCLICNPSIKFDLLLNRAADWGAERIATGHYARIHKRPGSPCRLLRGTDPVKDQSYFLARLRQNQLKKTILPLGAMTKDQTRQAAKDRGLRPAVAQESQDVCFIRNSSYAEFLLNQEGFTVRPGPIEDTAGRTIGRHQGLYRYTVGQRRGINCPAARPYYVVRLDPARNCLVVGDKSDLMAKRCEVTQVNWIVAPPRLPIEAQVQVRYRHKAAPATIIPEADHSARVIFETPEAAVTPGQGAVFFQGEEVLGGGWIQ